MIGPITTSLARLATGTATPARVTRLAVRRLDAPLAAEIDALARVAVEPNPFHEAWMLQAALEHLSAPPLHLLCVRDAAGTLTGLFPLRERQRRVPLPTLRSWEHDYLFLGSPLIARGHLEATVGATLDWLATHDAPHVLELVAVRDDGPLGAALRLGLARRPQLSATVTRRERALFEPGASGEGPSGRHRRELRRLERRLDELGGVAYRSLAAGDDPAPWIERFLDLEASGWKGRRGTAMGATPGSRAFFEQVGTQAHERGRLLLVEMTLGGRAIASKCNFTAGDAAFMFKIAYDEAHARHSPGLLLELFTMEQLGTGGAGIAWVDSCAAPEHFMAERLWAGRRALADYTLAGHGLLGHAVIRHGDRIRAARRRFRRADVETATPARAATAAPVPVVMAPGPLRVGPDRLALDFDRVPFTLEHDLCEHPLLQLPRLIELARTLPESSVEWNSGDLAIGQAPELTPSTGLGVEETLHQIEARNSWMVLKDVESDPEYARLLDACLDPLEPVLADVRPGMHRRQAFVFVSSPGAVTPFHVDYEHNFLLQLRGEKTVTVWDGQDRSVMSEEQREAKATGDQRNLPWRDDHAATGQRFVLRPGTGLQVPLSSPHWVRVADEVSVSLSVTFLTAHGARVRELHAANGYLRRHGVTPREVGRSPVTDAVQFNAARVLRRVEGAWGAVGSRAAGARRR